MDGICQTQGEDRVFDGLRQRLQLGRKPPEQHLRKLGLDLPDDPATGLLSNIADNTAQIADDVSVSSDDIKLLRDIAERQAINKYTTAEIKVEMVNHNNISNEMDLDGVVNLLKPRSPRPWSPARKECTSKYVRILHGWRAPAGHAGSAYD